MLQIVKDAFRLLTFRLTREEFSAFDRRHFIFGLVCTWLVGVGRYWDNPRAEFLQQLGAGSMVYIFALSLLLWLVVLPLRAKAASYFQILTFVSLVAPPAVLYAVPVQQFADLTTANAINSAFLLIVSVWRVALLIFFLRRFAGLNWFSVITAGLFPIVFIVTSLTVLNLERVVFDFMRGVTEPSPNDLAYEILQGLTFFSVLAFPVIFVCYIAAIVVNNSRRENENPPG